MIGLLSGLGLYWLDALIFGTGPFLSNPNWPHPNPNGSPEPGIYWERTGGKTHRVTIVRAP